MSELFVLDGKFLTDDGWGSADERSSVVLCNNAQNEIPYTINFLNITKILKTYGSDSWGSGIGNWCGMSISDGWGSIGNWGSTDDGWSSNLAVSILIVSKVR